MYTNALTALVLGAITAAAGAQPSQYPAQINLEDLIPANGGAGSDGFVIEGLAADDNLGDWVTTVGDINGDGFDDIAVMNDTFPAFDTVYVIFGPGVPGGEFDLSTLNGTNGFTITSLSAGTSTALNMAPGAGDLNGDGYPDILIGSSTVAPDGSGRVWVVFGGPTVGSSGSVDLTMLNGSNGYTILGGLPNERASRPGFIGDINGDTFGDIGIGTDANDLVGDAYVVFGGPTVGSTGTVDLSALTGADGFEINGLFDTNVVRSYTIIDAAGDIDGDGYGDVVIGSRDAIIGTDVSAGMAFVIFGDPSVGSSGTIDITSLSGSTGFTMHGGGFGWKIGYTVAGVGDVNRDGYDEIVIGASLPCSVPCQDGHAYLIWGKSNVGSSGLIELIDLLPANGGDGSVGFVFLGDAGTGGSLGRAIAGCDWNGDGYADIILGSVGGDAAAPLRTHGSEGDVRVVFGGPTLGFSGEFDTESLLPAFGGDGTKGVVLPGYLGFDSTGNSVSCAGDFNRDGVDDIMIAARRGDPDSLNDAGRVYIVYGKTPPPPPAFPPVVSLLDVLNGDGGFAVLGIAAFNQSGFSVASAGDLNNDGVDDVVIGAPFYPNGPGYGHAYVVFGGEDIASTSPIQASGLNGANGFWIRGEFDADRLGYDVAFAGDVNNDTIDDILLGAPQAGILAENNRGESYVVFGATGIGSTGLLDVSSLNGANGFALVGIDTGDKSGWSVSANIDINDDGIDDVIIGALDADPTAGGSAAGETYVVFGGTTVGSTGTVQLDALTGANGFTINGVDFSDVSGWVVSSAGDVNGDMIGDIIIGAKGGDNMPTDNAGEAYVVFGSDTAFAATLELSALNGANGFIITGLDSGDQAGRAVAGIGDVNDDGFDDVAVGVEFADPNSLGSAGEVWVIFGGASVAPTGTFDPSTLDGANGFIIEGLDANDFLGNSVSAAGDVNNDGIDDMIVGVRGGNFGPFNTGVAYVLLGNADIGETGTFDLTLLNGYNGFLIAGISNNDFAGFSVGHAGDVNGDGIDDVIIGATGADPNGGTSGETYIVFGRKRPCSSADFAEPFGVLNFYDYAAFLNAFDAAEERADLAGPDGDFDLRDIDVYQLLYLQGCVP